MPEIRNFPRSTHRSPFLRKVSVLSHVDHAARVLEDVSVELDEDRIQLSNIGHERVAQPQVLHQVRCHQLKLLPAYRFMTARSLTHVCYLELPMSMMHIFTVIVYPVLLTHPKTLNLIDVGWKLANISALS